MIMNAVSLLLLSCCRCSVSAAADGRVCAKVSGCCDCCVVALVVVVLV